MHTQKLQAALYMLKIAMTIKPNTFSDPCYENHDMHVYTFVSFYIWPTFAVMYNTQYAYVCSSGFTILYTLFRNPLFTCIEPE